MVINLEAYRVKQDCKILEMQILGEPIGYKAAIKGEHGFYSPKSYAAFKERVCDEIIYHKLQSGFHMADSTKHDRYALAVVVYRSRDTGDLDNFTKPVQDCLQETGIIWNDKQITDHVYPFCMRMDKKLPRLWFELWRIT